MSTIDLNAIVYDSFKSVLHSIPWWVWILIFAVFIIKIIVETSPKRRRYHKRHNSSARQDTPRTIFNEKLMPCPDCNKWISMNAHSCPHCGAPVTATYVNEVKSRRELQKRKEQKESDESSLLGVNGCSLVTLFLILFLILRFTAGILMWVLAGVVALLIVAGLCEIVRLRDKGKMGEEIVKQKLTNRLPKESYRVLNDIFLPLENGGTTQIDHIVVSVFGVFVIETKNYSGWIFADKGSQSWTQVLGNAKNHFQNPIRQNYLHLCAIADDLGLPKEILHGVVAFADDCEFKTERPEGVVFFNELAMYIQQFEKQVIQQCEADDIYSAIREWNASVTIQQRANHVRQLKQSHSQPGNNADERPALNETLHS